MDNLSKFLKDYRSDKNMSLREFAEYLNISHAYLSKLEKGFDKKTSKRVTPTIETLQKISDGLNISTRKFFEICGYIDKPITTINEAPSTDLDIRELVDNVLDSISKAENILCDGSYIDKKDTKIISEAIQIGFELLLRKKNNS